MKLAPKKIQKLAKNQGISLSSLLRRAEVSRTAYYSLARRPSVLPRTVHALARTLGVSTTDILEEAPSPPGRRALDRLRETREICQSQPGTSFENVWHTLCLLDLPPVERLNRSLIRGRPASVHR